MIIYITDRDLEILAHASTTLPDGYRVYDDRTVESVETGTNTFECVIAYTDDDRADIENAVQVGNYVLKQSARGDDDSNYDSVYQIIETEHDTLAHEIHLYAEDAGLDLLNTLCPAVTLNGTLYSMLDYFLPTDWIINLIDTPSGTRSYTWEGESTATERVLSVANLFGCEVYYSFYIDRLQVQERIVNVIEKRGTQEATAQLRLNFDVNNIRTTKSIADLVTAFKVTGGTPEGSETPITLVGYNYSYTDPVTGDVYKVDTATGQMRNVTAMGRWSSAIDSDGLWLGSFEYDTTDKAVLAGQARAQLQRDSQVAVNYEVDFSRLPDDIAIGDRVNIIDEHGELYLEARLLEIETCEAEDTKTAVIGEYLLRDSGINAQVAELASSLASQREADKALQESLQIISDTVDSMFTLEVDSDVVLNTAYLTARLLKGNKDIKTDYDPNWFKWILRSEDGERLLGRGYTLTADMDIIGYASTILCRFIRPQLYDLTDHNLTPITDQNLDPIQVSFAGIYNQPVVMQRSPKSRLKALRATPTVEVGDPTLNREVNLYEKGGFGDAVGLFTGNKGGYVVLKQGDNGQPEEILVMDTPNIETARNVWRWNKEGIGYSSNGYNGTYETAWTIDGTFVGDFIKAGTISDKDNNNYWNLQTGYISTKEGAIGGFFVGGERLYRLTDINYTYLTSNYIGQRWKPSETYGRGIAITGGFITFEGVGADVGFEETWEKYGYIQSYLSDEFGNSISLGIGSDYRYIASANGTYKNSFRGAVYMANGLLVAGSKSRIVKTPTYDDRLLYCYETPTPLFGDIGEATIDEDGFCYVDIDDIFSETIAEKVEYQVFLQKEGEGDCYVAEKAQRYFVIKGTPNLKVAWELKAKQRDYELTRLEPSKTPYVDEDYVTESDDLYDYILEQEGVLYAND